MKNPLPPVGPYAVEVFYDGDCPLCLREINMIRRKDKRGRIRFTDIAAHGFNAADYGKTFDGLMAEIHGRDSEGNWLVGVEVFRRLYSEIGFGSVVAMTRWPLVAPTLDVAYRWFAKRRLGLTGRCQQDRCAAPEA